MLDVGFSEILLTSAIALIVLGPERLPKVARQVGNWMGRARAMARQLSEQLEREVSAEELLKTQNKPVAATPPSPIYSPSIMPPAAVAPDAAVAPETVASAAAPDPTYGRPAAATTPAAMHAEDPPADSHAATTGNPSPHE
jgi:sec-independent protein translocase protein TatB